VGHALSAAVAADPELSAQRVQEICRLSLQRKLDPEHRGRAEALIEASRTGAVDAEAALLATVPSEAPADKGDRSAPRAFATWVCNGRRIDLEVDGQPISARH
ncbi:unnamed protein product, partial [Polarella glacialis]